MIENCSLTGAGPSAEDRWDREVANIRADFQLGSSENSFLNVDYTYQLQEFIIKHLSLGGGQQSVWFGFGSS